MCQDSHALMFFQLGLAQLAGCGYGGGLCYKIQR